MKRYIFRLIHDIMILFRQKCGRERPQTVMGVNPDENTDEPD